MLHSIPDLLPGLVPIGGPGRSHGHGDDDRDRGDHDVARLLHRACLLEEVTARRSHGGCKRHSLHRSLAPLLRLDLLRYTRWVEEVVGSRCDANHGDGRKLGSGSGEAASQQTRCGCVRAGIKATFSQPSPCPLGLPLYTSCVFCTNNQPRASPALPAKFPPLALFLASQEVALFRLSSPSLPLSLSTLFLSLSLSRQWIAPVRPFLERPHLKASLAALIHHNFQLDWLIRIKKTQKSSPPSARLSAGKMGRKPSVRTDHLVLYETESHGKFSVTCSRPKSMSPAEPLQSNEGSSCRWIAQRLLRKGREVKRVSDEDGTERTSMCFTFHKPGYTAGESPPLRQH
jgi:hypothetical protein